jgi:hypothetical protein
MKRKCTACGTEHELGPNTLPECPECIRARFKYPKGVKPKHTLSGASSAATYASYGDAAIDPDNIFRYMAYGPHTTASGCAIFYSMTHGSFNAVSHLPLGQIPGSGIKYGHHFAAHYAVLVDLEGKSNDGPHWEYEDQAHLDHRLSTGEWIPVPMCASCGKVVVYNSGDICLNCQK